MRLREMKTAGRRLARRPGYVALSIAALGAGVVLLLFRLINTLMLRRLLLPQADRRAPQTESAAVAALCCLHNPQATA